MATAWIFPWPMTIVGKVLPEACRAGGPPKPLNLAAVFLASGMRSLAKLDSRAHGGAGAVARDHLRKTQSADGSWTMPKGRFLPILGDGESTTLLAALALSRRGFPTGDAE